MAGARTFVGADVDPVLAAPTVSVDPEARVRRTACLAAMVLAIIAPFEALRPLLTLPGQSLTTVEATLLAVMAMVGAALIAARQWRWLDSKDLAAWSAFLVVAAIAAFTAPQFRSNAIHMTARLATAFVVWGIVVIGGKTPGSRRSIATAVVVTAAFVSLLVIADFVNVPAIRSMLLAFRDGIAEVGGQVRASGPFQYPTITSMYLEIAFALGLGLLFVQPHGANVTRTVVIASLALIFEGIVLTFARSGLIAAWLSLAGVAVIHWRQRGVDKTAAALAVLAAVMAAELLSSHSMEMLTLRLTSEGQGQWFRAAIAAPSDLAFSTNQIQEVTVTLTNTGRATWDSNADEPIRFTYHWMADDSDTVIAWEGIRTLFPAPVVSGETVTVRAQVRGPNRPGRFRLMWDLEQEHKRWFSTEPDADFVVSRATVTGSFVATPAPDHRTPARLPQRTQRPGRGLLWGAALRMWLERPWLGVGPDNFRLLYGRFASVAVADPRVHSNNMYIEILAGMGIAGVATMAWLGLRLLRGALAAIRADGLGLGVAAACAACAVHGLADSFLTFTGTYILMAIVAGLACAYRSDGVGHAHRI